MFPNLGKGINTLMPAKNTFMPNEKLVSKTIFSRNTTRSLLEQGTGTPPKEAYCKQNKPWVKGDCNIHHR